MNLFTWRALWIIHNRFGRCLRVQDRLPRGYAIGQRGCQGGDEYQKISRTLYNLLARHRRRPARRGQDTRQRSPRDPRRLHVLPRECRGRVRAHLRQLHHPRSMRITPRPIRTSASPAGSSPIRIQTTTEPSFRNTRNSRSSPLTVLCAASGTRRTSLNPKIQTLTLLRAPGRVISVHAI